MKCLCLFIPLACASYCFGQLTSTGSIQFRAESDLNERSPKWSLAGNVTLKFRKWSLPFSGSYSNRVFSYTHPFNKICLRPEIGRIKLQAGYCNLNWSPLYFTGETFLGSGMEYKHKGSKLGSFYGQFRKPNTREECYSDRRGAGLQFGIKRKYWESGMDGLYFHERTPGQTLLENYFGGAQFTIRLTKTLHLNSEHGFSLFVKEIFRMRHQVLLVGKGKFLPWNLALSQTDAGFRTLGMNTVSNDEIRIRATLSPLLGKRIRASLNYYEIFKGISPARIQKNRSRSLQASLNYRSKTGFLIKTNGNYSRLTSHAAQQDAFVPVIIRWNSVVQMGLQYPIKKLKHSLGMEIKDLRSGLNDTTLHREQQLRLGLDPIFQLTYSRRKAGLSSQYKGKLFGTRYSWNAGLEAEYEIRENPTWRWQARLDLKYISKNKKARIEIHLASNPQFRVQLNTGWSW